MARKSPSELFEDQIEYREKTYPDLGDFSGPEMDFSYERLHYGRIDQFADPVVLQESLLKQVPSTRNTTVLVVDFVAEAFKDLKRHVRRAATKGAISKSSLLNDLKAVGGWESPHTAYHQHMDKIYQAFILHMDGEDIGRNVTNFDEFMTEFIKWSRFITSERPITKTGYIGSYHCSPMVSGLHIELKSWDYNSTTKRDYIIEDPNYVFFRNAARKFGFMVDKNAPWRLTANIRSYSQWPNRNLEGELTGETNEGGMQAYMNQEAVTYENFFSNYYSKTYIQDLEILSTYMYVFYESFVAQNPVAVRLHTKGGESNKCSLEKEIVQRYSYATEKAYMQEYQNAVLPSSFTEKYDDSYWLQVYFTLRILESKVHMPPAEYRYKLKRAKKLNFAIDQQASLSYINRETKGFRRINMATKGKFWQGYQGDSLKRVSQAQASNIVSSDPKVSTY